MDYSGIINLVLVTAFFSTLLAPNLKKIGEIKDLVADVDFPIIKRSDSDRDEEAIKKGVELTKRLTQYEDKYNETKHFLRYFYIIIALISAIQVWIMVIQNSLITTSGVIFFGAVIVIIIVSMTIRYHMTKPSIIRSIQWLSDKGIAVIHTSMLFNPQLSLNSGSRNIISDGDSIRISIRSNADLNGYGYILTVESVDYKKLYNVCVGFVGEQSTKTRLKFTNGEMGFEILLAKLKLNPSDYVARLIFLTSAYDGNYAPSETIINFNASNKNKNSTNTRIENIQTEGNSYGYLFTVKHKNNRHKITNIEFNEIFSGNDNISFILSSDRLLNYLRKGHRPVAFFSKRGDIDRYDLEKYLSLSNVVKRRFLKRIRNKFKSRGQLILLNRKSESRLKTY